jgi:hypothetical protein
MHKAFRIFMPYCLDKQPDGGYVALNRDYKPLGFDTGDFVNYQRFPITHSLKGLSPTAASEISCHGTPDLSRIYLYNDGCNPANGKARDMSDYMRRLERLSRLSIRKVVGGA